MDKLKKNNIPIYSIYTELPVEKSRAKMMEYFENKGPTIVAATSNLHFPFSPFNGVVDLRTMKFVKMEGEGVYLSIDDIVRECAKLK